jgi:uncharacterized protein YxeA
LQDCISKIPNTKKKTSSVAQRHWQCLYSKPEALSSNPSTTKIKINPLLLVTLSFYLRIPCKGGRISTWVEIQTTVIPDTFRASGSLPALGTNM